MSDEQDDEDPFADMDAPEDDSDPFENLAGATDDETDEQSTDDVDESVFESADSPGDTGPSDAERRPDDDPFSRDPLDEETDADTAESAGAGAGADVWGDDAVEDTPEGDLFTEMETSRRDRSVGDEEGDPFEAFESPDVDEIDPDEIWERLSRTEGEDHVSFDEKVYYEVSKHRFCEQCEYFSAPPETACTYEGADIVEFLDMDTVRLVNCPVVKEYRELGNE
jgi:hypothetical protein